VAVLSQSSSRFKWVTYLLSAILFTVIVFLPMTDEFFALVPETTVAESGGSKLPRLAPNLASANDFFDRLRGGFLEKNFGFRGLLIKWYNYMDAYVLASTFSSSPVVVGKDSWLFLSQDGPDRNILEEHRAVTPLPEEKMRRIMEDLEARRDWLAERGIPYLAVVAPNKNTVYPEMLPGGFERVNENSHLDQLLTYIRRNSTLDVIDLRPALFAEKKRHQVFYATDSHWNARGGYAAYRVIMKALARYFPDMSPVAREKYAEVVYRGLPGDLAFMLGLQEQLPEKRLLFVTSHKARGVNSREPNIAQYFQPPQASAIKGSSLPRAVFFHDSFFWELMPFLAEHFSHADYLWMNPQTETEPRFFNKELILKEKPDIVVDEFTERYFVPSSKPLKSVVRKDEAAASN
jgi:alginate O-acetyltransferase complex protein AlgJ